MWQRFTENARKVVFYAQEEAQGYGEGFVSTEHLLLGILREDDSVAARVLVALGVTLAQVREEVEKNLSAGDGRPNQNMTLTPRAKRVIDLAYDEARNLNQNYIGTEHLLLGLVKEGEGVAGKALKALGIEIDRARVSVFAIQHEEEEAGRRGPSASSKEAPVRTSLFGSGTNPPPDPWRDIDAFARRAIVFGEMEALRRGQSFLSPEHLLLGLLREAESPAVHALERLGFAPEVVRDAVAARCRDSGTPLKGESTLSPATGNVFRIAYQEQVRLRAKELGAEHLLLGLLIEPDGLARHVLEELGLDADGVRATIVKAAWQEE